MQRRERSPLPPGAVLLLTILFLAIPVRLYVASQMGTISRDGAHYIWYAQDLATDPIGEIRSQDHHPLYPLTLLGVQRLLPHVGRVADIAPQPLRVDIPGLPPGIRVETAQPGGRKTPLGAYFYDDVLSWQTAGMIVTFIGGIAVVLGVYAVATVLFEPRVGLLAAGLTALAAEFVQLSADVLTDMPHLALYLFALACALRGVRRSRLAWFIPAGLLSGIAFLVRPEGAEVAVTTAVLVLFMREWRARKRLAAAVLVGIFALAVASPYMALTGKLVPKKSIGQLIAAPAPTADATHTPRAQCAALLGAGGGASALDLAKIIEKYARSLRITYLLPAILWLVLLRGEGWARGHRLMLALFILHVLILVRLILAFDYGELLSIRHALIPAALTIPYTAAGLRWLIDRAPERHRNAATIAGFILLVGPTLPWMLEPRNAEELYLRQAGEQLRGIAGEGPRVLTTRNLVPFYAGGRQVWSPRDANLEQILAEAREKRPDFLAFDARKLLKERPTFFDELEAAALPGERIEALFIRSQSLRDRREQVIVYRYAAPGPSTRPATTPEQESSDGTADHELSGTSG